ncbi:helix-turn-helix domain-containing protein [Exiguobacterium oxidotolerans]|uniref:helix-turn-helix domain-containing protein n=1 Tax=Exiguobacterium oxidotolerans TaxID=223958 RepID=UPI000493C5E9|nr:helix-turn-helix transcriptional regulator [Exiguobacterium oxidotolerans]
MTKDKQWKSLKREFESLDEKDLIEIDLVVEVVKRRKEKRLSQRDLAELTGLKQSSIARIERDIVMPKLNTFIKIATALELELELVSKK